MNPAEFRHMLGHCPLLFGRLLARQGIADSPEVRRRILAFYDGMKPQEVLEYRRKPLRRRRLVSLACLAGFDPTDAAMPLRLYGEYVAGVTAAPWRATVDRTFVPEEEIRYWLTHGTEPVEHWCLVAGEFYVWCAREHDFCAVVIEDGDPLLHEAAKAFLKVHGQSFLTLAEAREEAVRRGLTATIDT
jgi:hypothetical protein